MSGNGQNIIELPEIDQATIDRIETAVFDQLEERPPASPPVARAGRRRWLTAGGIAAAFVVGVLLTPAVASIVDRSMQASDGAGGERLIEAPVDGRAEGTAGAEGGDTSAGAGGGSSSAGEDASAGRKIIAAAEVTVLVDDITAAAEDVTAVAERYDGYVEDSDVAASTADAGDAGDADSGEGSWVSIRVPAADLTAVIGEVSGTGEVVRSSISRQDVTSTTRDLQARVDASKASVQRLTELMSKSGSLSDLIAAESALAERQAQLESYQQELKGYEDQVAMSTVRVQLTERASAKAEPAGFADGLLTGWNGLITSLNAVVIAVGFLLPWIVVAGVVVLVVWLVRRIVVRRRSRAPADAEA